MPSTRHLVDPELLEALDASPTSRLSLDSLPATRALRAEQLVQQLAQEPDVPGVVTREHHIPGPPDGPEVRVVVYLPLVAPQPVPAFVWIHGGGYVLGTPEGDGLEMKQLAADVGCVVFSVDYRLAPESPFPAGVEDCYAALRWTHANARELGIDAGRIAIGGSSAGGGLAAALALLARDRGEVAVAYQALRVPMLDDRTVAAAEPHPWTGEFVWTTNNNRVGWTALLGREPGGDNVSPYAAPARAESLAGLPPTFISTGALDLFVEEDMEYARRLMRAGVPTELHVYPGAYHGFSRAANARLTLSAARDFGSALKRAFESAPTREVVPAG